MDGGHDPDAVAHDLGREPLGQRDTGVLQRIIEIRQSHPALRRGKLTMLGQKLDGDALVFLRHTDKINEVALVVINNATQPLRQIVFTPHSHLYHALQ